MGKHRPVEEIEASRKIRAASIRKKVHNRVRVMTLYKEGYVAPDIASRLQMPLTTVKDYITRYKDVEESDYSDAPRKGRPTLVSPRARKNIIAQIETGESTQCSEVAATMRRWGLCDVSAATIRNVLKSAGLYTIKKIRKPLLSEKNIEERLKWCLLHQHWTAERWLKVIFSDETTIQVHKNHSNQRVWVKKGFKLDNRVVHGTLKYGGGKIMVWGAITAKGISFCHRIDGTLDTTGYIGLLNKALKDTLSYYNLDDSYIFQQDNAPCHVSKGTMEWLKENKIQTMEWPAQSPDLNPIENVWAELKRRIYGRGELKTPDQVWEAFQNVYEEFDAETCRKYLLSMPARIAACIDNSGGYTRW